MATVQVHQVKYYTCSLHKVKVKEGYRCALCESELKEIAPEIAEAIFVKGIDPSAIRTALKLAGVRISQ